MRYLTLLLIAVLAQVTFAQSLVPNYELGTRTGAFSARNLGLGRTFMVHDNGPSSLMGNPATLTDQTTMERWDISVDVSRVKETRSYPIYDAFNAVLIYNNYAMNDHLYSKLNGGVSVRFPLKQDRCLVLAAGTYSTYGFDYTYHEEVRNRYSEGGIQDIRLGNNNLEINGDLRSISIGGATNVLGPVSLGLSYSVLAGDYSYTKGVYYKALNKTNLEDHIDFSPKGTSGEINIGALYPVNDRISIGARALMPTGKYKFGSTVTSNSYSMTVDNDTLKSGDIEQKYPSHYGVGVQYRPQNEYRPVLSFDTEIHKYKDILPEWDNTWEFRAGVEQQVVPGIPVRLGLVYYTSPASDEQATTLYTAGIGFKVEKFSGDLGVELGKINYSNDDLFPQTLYDQTNRIDRDHVETAWFRGMITLRYEL
jgi:hypothetical protein